MGNLEQKDELKPSLLLVREWSKFMQHNIESYNQLAAWNHTDEKLDEYYECIIDCDIGQESSSCKRICREILM